MAMSFSSVSRALPESMISAARATPAFSVSAFPSMYSAAPAFMRTAFRLGPVSPPLRMARVMAAFSAGVPPTRSALVQRAKPKSSGAMV